ncbi:helix-turn-helix domain-containing protein [Streptomyces orinoci]|uniref:helix-turn-helix domain-containing protein n=1 Tax=Streptomyces orinoci TaxID=67339 RepID=UPI003BAC2E5B
MRRTIDEGMTVGAGSEAGDFAELLRELKERSGRSYGALAGRLHMSTSTLHRYRYAARTGPGSATNPQARDGSEPGRLPANPAGRDSEARSHSHGPGL